MCGKLCSSYGEKIFLCPLEKAGQTGYDLVAFCRVVQTHLGSIALGETAGPAPTGEPMEIDMYARGFSRFMPRKGVGKILFAFCLLTITQSLCRSCGSNAMSLTITRRVTSRH